MNETDSRVRARLQLYWRAASDDHGLKMGASDVPELSPWSAAFISYVACAAGVSPADLPPASRHLDYVDHVIFRAIRTPDDPTARFVPAEPMATALRPGDLLCADRGRSDGAPELDRWQLPPAARLRREIQAARRALEARYPGRLAPGPDLYVGFSQGAHRISRMAVDDPAAYPRVQLVEGGASLWRDARRYARSEGRVAFVCAMRWCEMRGTRAARTLERGRAQARLERRDGAHHDLRVMEPAIRETFEWLVAGDARFGAAPLAYDRRPLHFARDFATTVRRGCPGLSPRDGLRRFRRENDVETSLPER